MKSNGLLLSIFIFINLCTTNEVFARDCVNIGDGPIQDCYMGNSDRGKRIARPFIYKKDERRYVWSFKDDAYCFRNKYNNFRCMQKWEADILNCKEMSNGQLYCE